MEHIFLFQSNQTAQDDHVIQLKLGVVKQKSHFLIKFYKSLILASSMHRSADMLADNSDLI